VTSAVTDLAALHPAWAERFNAGDLDGMLRLYEHGAVFLPEPGRPVAGSGLRGALQEFIDLGVPVRVTVRHTARVGEIGLIVADWRLDGTRADGESVSMAGSASDVARLHPGHGWRFVIDNAFGTA